MPFSGRVRRDADAGDGDGPGQGPEDVCDEGLEEVETWKGGQEETSELGGERVEDVGPVDGLL